MVKKLKDITDNASLNKMSDIPIAVELQEAFAQLQGVEDLDVFMYELNKIIKDKITNKEKSR